MKINQENFLISNRKCVNPKSMAFDITVIQEEICNHLIELTGLSRQEIENSLEATKIHKKCDFTLALGRILTQRKDLDIELLHNKIIEEINKSNKLSATNNSNYLLTVELTGKTFYFNINTRKFAKRIVNSILQSDIYEYQKKGNYYGYQNIGKNENVCIEHSSPNIAKKFHAGHLRTSIIGNSLVHLFDFLNFNVIRINHLGDWGKQFGVVGIGFKKYGSETELSKDPIKHLLDVYVKINQDLKEEVEKLKQENSQNDSKAYERLDKYSKIDAQAKEYFSNLEKGREQEISDWKRFRELSLIQYKKTYKVLNIEFDDELGESFYALNNLGNIEDATKDKNGDLMYCLGKLGNFVVKKANGSTLYSTRDIAAIEYRIKTYNPKKIIYVVASEQKVHFQRLFSVANGEHGLKKRIPEGTELLHVDFGLINGLSTRKGNLIFLDDIIDMATEKMLENMSENETKFNKIENAQKTATILAVSALIIQDLSSKRIKDYDFDIKRCTNYEGHTGPYLQYTHCRLVSIRNKNKDFNPVFNLDYCTDDASNLIFFLSRFPSIISDFYKSLEPCGLVKYLMFLCGMVNKLFKFYKVFGAEKEIGEARLAVFESARIVICNGMKLLGMIPLDRM